MVGVVKQKDKTTGELLYYHIQMGRSLVQEKMRIKQRNLLIKPGKHGRAKILSEIYAIEEEAQMTFSELNHQDSII